MYVVPGLLGSLVMYLFSRSSGVHRPVSSVLMSLPMMLFSALFQTANQYAQRRRYQRAVTAREEKYRALLQEIATDLQNSQNRQRMALCQTDPDHDACLERVQTMDARMWERSANDKDFGQVRLGIGNAAFSVTVKTHEEERKVDQDPLQNEARALADQFAQVDRVPVTVSLSEAGATGMVGDRKQVLAMARSLAIQLAVHHSPGELKIGAVFPVEEASEWACLRWLPHVWSNDRRTRFLAANDEPAEQLLSGLYDLMTQRRLQLGAVKNSGASTPTFPLIVFFLADLDLVQNQAAVSLMMREGQTLGVIPIVLEGRKELLPKECRTIFDLDPGFGRLLQTDKRTQYQFVPDAATAEFCETFSRAMAPIGLREIAAGGAIPEKVDLLELLGVSRTEEIDVAERWLRSEPYRSLAAPIGLRAGGETVELDLHERGHGPHGLVAGATGSGKSEVLQTVVTSLAVSFHPHELAFVMVDFKGGGMADLFKDLPHLIGTITNLEGNLARRAMGALEAELKRRQTLLKQAGVNHVDAYIRLRRQGHSLDPLPHLVIIVDEFAELKANHPEFMKALTSAFRVGRSLGVHLILATQKPAGVVDEQMWSNSKFRLCLRVERPQDSQEVIKCPDAASIAGAGRGYFQVGNNERFELFQAGWGGALYAPDQEGAVPSCVITEVDLSGHRISNRSPASRQAPEGAPAQLQAVVQRIRQAAAELGVEPLQGPWLPPLPQRVSLSDLEAGAGDRNGQSGECKRWLQPAIGLADDPANQRQVPLRLDFGKEGHLAIYGAPGTGKTTLVQTLVRSLCLTHSPAEINLYLVDCSGRSLSALAPLPHVGGVILGEELEPVSRLLQFLVQELEDRKALFSQVGVNTVWAYNQSGAAKLPALVVIFDNYPAFATAYQSGEELLVGIAREGANLGVFLVLTATNPAAIRTKISGNVTMAVTLQLADRTEYHTAVGRTNGLEPMPYAGRGLVKSNPPLEFQTALPIEGETEWEMMTSLRQEIAAMAAAWDGRRARGIKVLPSIRKSVV